MPIATRMPAPTPVQDSIPIPPKVPQLPDDVIKRFPSLAQWQEDENSWWARATNALQSNNRTISQSVTKQAKDTSNLTVSFNDFKVVIEDEVDTIVTDQVAMGRRIISVSAQVGVNQNIKIQNSAPVGPALNDYWIDNSNLATPITYKWNGAGWVEVSAPIAVAGVADERTARVTADGFLEGKYTLTVIAGNVVTGMNITSSSGGGTNVSSVIFRATDFQIYNGVLGKTMFSVSGTDVQLAGVLTTSTSGKVYIGTGTYGNTNTSWYVDSSGNFSLKDKLTWDGTTLSVTGNVVITSGTNYAGSPSVGGSANTIVGQAATATSSDFAVITGATKPENNATLGAAWGTNLTGRPTELTDGRISTAISAAGLVVSGVHPGINVTTGSAGLYLGADFMGYYNGAAWKTYMDSSGNFYLGGTSGSLQWNGSTLAITGAITATSGAIGGWTINSSTLSNNNAILDSAGQLILGTGNDVVYLSATDASYRIWIGNAAAGSAAFRVTKAGAMFATSATISGSSTFSGIVDIGSGTSRIYADSSKFTYGYGQNERLEIFYDNSAGVASEVLDIYSGGTKKVRVASGTPFGTATGFIDLTDDFGGRIFMVAGSAIYTYGGSGTYGIQTHVTADAGIRWGAKANGELRWGDGTNVTDTNLYRSSSNVLKTDDDLIVDLSLTVNSSSTLNGSLTVNSTIHATGVVTFDTDITTGGRIQRPASNGWTVNVFDGTYEISFQYDGANLYARINDGGSPILLG